MSICRTFALSAAISALAFFPVSGALAQDATTPAGASYTAEIPAEYATHDYATEVQRTVDEDGTIIETVTRTRRIPARTTTSSNSAAYQPVVWDRETWLAECHARTRGVERKKRGGIIGGLLGAITGGLIGNRAWDSERLAGTLIGAGAGGLVGGLIGNAIENGGDNRPYYNCEEALDRYMSGTAAAPRVATRTIPPYGYAPTYAPAYGHAYGYAPVYAQPYAYPQQMTYVQTTEEIPQQVVVREYVTEEWVEQPAPQRAPAVREIKRAPAPSGKIVPVTPASVKTD